MAFPPLHVAYGNPSLKYLSNEQITARTVCTILVDGGGLVAEYLDFQFMPSRYFSLVSISTVVQIG